ncbi:MAG: hypothetical protein LC804_12175 [Acidobacteria bacterium]|nr:hypothetical protein [Acidobacteriota bacterium]
MPPAPIEAMISYGPRRVPASNGIGSGILAETRRIRFPFSMPVPVTLIEGIAKFRAKEVAEREKGRAAVRKQR